MFQPGLKHQYAPQEDFMVCPPREMLSPNQADGFRVKHALLG